MKRKTILRVLLLAVLLTPLFAVPTLVSACPGCKEALFDPGQLAQKLSLSRGYALSIGLMLAVPFALVGGFVWVIARSTRRR